MHVPRSKSFRPSPAARSDARSAKPDAWAEGVQRIHAASGGVVAINVIWHGDLPGLVARAMAGDRNAIRLAAVTASTVGQIDRAPRRRPALCATCPRPVRRFKFTVAVVLPERDDASEGMGLAICQHCATTPAAVMVKAVSALSRIWPESRTIDVTHGAGGQA